jgi:hypothetical protein
VRNETLCCVHHGLTDVQHVALDVVYSLSPMVEFVLKNPVVNRTAENQRMNRIIDPIAAFCPRVFLLSVQPSGRWMVGAVGIELVGRSLSLAESTALTPLHPSKPY